MCSVCVCHMCVCVSILGGGGGEVRAWMCMCACLYAVANLILKRYPISHGFKKIKLTYVEFLPAHLKQNLN